MRYNVFSSIFNQLVRLCSRDRYIQVSEHV